MNLLRPLSQTTSLLEKHERRAIAFCFFLGAIFFVASWFPELWKFLQEGFHPADWIRRIGENWKEISREVAKFLFSVSALMAVILAYLRQGGAHVDDLRVRLFFRKHTILCGMSTRSKLLAQDLARKGKNVVIVNLDEKHEETSEVRMKGVSVIQGNAKSSEVLERAGFKHALNLVCMTNSDETNLAILETVRATFESPNIRRNVGYEMNCFCHIRSPNLRGHLERLAFIGAKDSGVHFRAFSIEDISAAELLRTHPPERHLPLDRQASDVHVALFGGGNFALALALQMAQVCHYWRADYKAETCPRSRLTIVAPEVDVLLQRLRQMCPDIDLLLELCAVPLAPESPAAYQALLDAGTLPVSQFYIALDEEVTSLAVASQVAKFLRKTAVNDNVGVVAIMPARLQRINPNAWNRDSRVDVFESYESCKDDVVIGGVRDRMAEAAHNEYLRKALENGKKMGDHPAMCEWSSLNEFLRASNRQQVAHLGVKMRALGWEIIESEVDSKLRSPDLTGEQLEQLADMEQRRWMAFYYVHGWVPAKVRNDAMLEHDCMVSYCHLPEGAKKYNRATVRGAVALCQVAGYSLRSSSGTDLPAPKSTSTQV